MHQQPERQRVVEQDRTDAFIGFLDTPVHVVTAAALFVAGYWTVLLGSEVILRELAVLPMLVAAHEGLGYSFLEMVGDGVALVAEAVEAVRSFGRV